MLLCIVDHVAALAEGCEITQAVVGGIVIEMGTGEDHASGQHWVGPGDVLWVRQVLERSASTVAPDAIFLVPPTSIAEMGNMAVVGPLAMLTSSLGALKTNHV